LEGIFRLGRIALFERDFGAEGKKKSGTESKMLKSCIHVNEALLFKKITTTICDSGLLDVWLLCLII
jgi:hypothetical protein